MPSTSNGGGVGSQGNWLGTFLVNFPSLTAGPFSVGVLGFLASCLVVLGGSLAGAAGVDGGWLIWSAPKIPVEPAVPILLALIVYFGGLLLLVRAWLLLRRTHLAARADELAIAESTPSTQISPEAGLARWTVLLIIAAWALPMILGPPLASRDVYAYGAQGRLAEQGYDVYEVGPAALGSDDPILAPVDPLYRETPVLYGPAFVSLSSVGAAITGSSPESAVVFYRLLAVASLIAAAFGIFDTAKSLRIDPVDALILGVANPLVLLHLVSGAHNDAIMLGFLLVGIAAGLRMKRPHLAVVLCAIAAAIKLPAMLAVAFIGWPWVTSADGFFVRARRLIIIGVEALAVLAIAGQLTGWGWSWVRALAGQEHVEAYLSVTTLIGSGLSYLPGVEFDDALPVSRLVGVVMAIGLTAMLLFRPSRGWVSTLAWSFLCWAVLHPTTQPWYLTWGMLVLAATASGHRNRLYIATSAIGIFAVLPIGPQLGIVLLDSTTWIALLGAVAIMFCLTFSFGRPASPVSRSGAIDTSMVSVVVPTRNEALNVEPFVDSLHHVVDRAGEFGERSVEILFVDDSHDDTPNRISVLAKKHRQPGRLVRGDHRHSNRRWGGLGGAVVDGLVQTQGGIVVVMDGDLQHPPSLVPELVAEIDRGADLAVASRRLGNGSDHEGLTKTRHRLSIIATAIAQRLFPSSVGEITDPLSGYFAVRLDRLNVALLQPDGFKILIELLVTHPELKATELPFTFGGRVQGVSKASGSEGLRFLGHLLDLWFRRSRLWAGARMPQKYFTGQVVAAGLQHEQTPVRD